MKKLFYSGLILLIAGSFAANAQTADEIIKGYFENTGGYEAWGEIKGMKMTAKVNQGGMEIPIEIYQMSDGRMMTVINFQGQEMKQGVYDGETLWSTNFQTMKPEKSDEETTANMKKDANDFPDALYDYEEKGYTVELMGTETIDGTETYKIKLTKEPKIIDGQETADITYYYFDKDAYVPLAIEAEIKQGPAKGMISQSKMSDYQEVDGFYFPFSMTQGVKDGQSQPIQIESIILNPEVDDSQFAFPSEN